MDNVFVQPPEQQPLAPIAEATGVPVIDLSPLAATPPPPGAVHALAPEVGAACRDWGFFVAVGHGVPEATAARAVEVGRAFFALPPERKAAVRRTERAPLEYYDAELTRNLHIFAINIVLLQLCVTVQEHRRTDQNLSPCSVSQRGAGGVRGGNGGAGVQAAGADRPEPEPETRPAARLLPGADDDVHADQPVPSVPSARPRARPRPPQGQRRPGHPAPGWRRRPRRPPPLRRRVGPRQARPWLARRQRRRHHSGVEQRQVRERGAPGVGELEQERLSIPYFFNPSTHTLVEPLPEMVSEERPSRYHAYSWGEFFRTRRRSNFRKMEVDNIQIAHLRKGNSGSVGA